MRIALVCDESFLHLEPESFGNLVVGLINEQFDVVQIVPESVRAYASSFGQQVYYTQSHFQRFTNRNLLRLGSRNKEDGGIADMKIDLFHALHSSVWAPVAALTKKLDATAAFNLTGYKDIGNIKHIKPAINNCDVTLLPVTAALGDAAKQKVHDSNLITTIGPGVHIQKQQRQPNAPITAIISGNGILDRHYKILLKAISTVVANYPESQFFFDGAQADQYRIWREAKKLNLLGNISLVPDNLLHREILLRADVLIHPQPLGEAKSITLEAMARGLPVIAHYDQWLDYLIDDQTAWILHEPEIEDWVTRLLQLSQNPDSGFVLGERAQDWIRENCLASGRLIKLVDAYRRLIGASLPFR